MSGFLGSAAEEKRCPVVTKKPSHYCYTCGSNTRDYKCTRKDCLVRYCSKVCEDEDWHKHQSLCKELHKIEEFKGQESTELEVYANIVSETERKVANIVGKKCVVKVVLDGLVEDALWDTGAQVSLVDEDWLNKRNCSHEVKNVYKVLGQAVNVEGVCGQKIPYKGIVTLPLGIGDSDMIDVPFFVSTEKISRPIIGSNVMEMLVKQDENVFKNVGKCFESLTAKEINVVVNLLKTNTNSLSDVKIQKQGVTIPAGKLVTVSCKVKVENLSVDTPVLFEGCMEHPFKDEVIIFDEMVSIKSGHSSRLKIQIFNKSNLEVHLPGRMHVGELSLVRSVTPADVKECDIDREEFKLKKDEESGAGDAKMNGEGAGNAKMTEEINVNESNGAGHAGLKGKGAGNAKMNEDVMEKNFGFIKSENKNNGAGYAGLKGKGAGYAKTKENVKINSIDGPKTCQDFHDFALSEDDHLYAEQLNKIDLNTLSEEERDIAMKLLWEEREVFAKDDDDIGDAKDFVIDITTDAVPVQRTYNAIPRPLYEDVKHHIEDMLNRGWIKKSKSAWSSPVVIVRKKCGGLRICW